MPPTETLEDYLELVRAIKQTATDLKFPIVLEGYLTPRDHRLQIIKVTPDPGVIEVNVHPVKSWTELVLNTTTIYADARQCRLATEKFDLDGKHTGTGGGNHVVMGGPTPWDSPFLRRPDVLRSLISFWINHSPYRTCLHPTIPGNTPLVFDLWDIRTGHSIGGCTYHVAHPGGRNYATFPVNAFEAEGKRNVRFLPFGHTPGNIIPRMPRENPEFPSTLDLRRESF